MFTYGVGDLPTGGAFANVERGSGPDYAGHFYWCSLGAGVNGDVHGCSCLLGGQCIPPSS